MLSRIKDTSLINWIMKTFSYVETAVIMWRDIVLNLEVFWMGSGTRLIQTHVCGCLETAILTKRGAHLSAGTETLLKSSCRWYWQGRCSVASPGTDSVLAALAALLAAVNRQVFRRMLTDGSGQVAAARLATRASCCCRDSTSAHGRHTNIQSVSTGHVCPSSPRNTHTHTRWR